LKEIEKLGKISPPPDKKKTPPVVDAPTSNTPDKGYEYVVQSGGYPFHYRGGLS